MTHANRTGINPDSIPVLWFTVCLVSFLAVSSFMVSFTGLHEVAAWAGLPFWLRWAVPVFVDVAILAYTLAVLIHRHRGERTWPSWLSLAGFTAFSVAANGAHAMAIDHVDMLQRVVGVAAAAAAPLAVFTATEQLARLIITNPDLRTPAADDAPEAPSASGPAELPAARQETAPARVPQEEPSAAPEIPEPTSESAAETPAAAPEISDDLVEPDTDGRDDEPSATAEAMSRPGLSLVMRSPENPALEEWIAGELSAGRTPTGKSVGEFLGVSERTGRNRLTDLRRDCPDLFVSAEDEAEDDGRRRA
jgi:hypothetical protein